MRRKSLPGAQLQGPGAALHWCLDERFATDDFGDGLFGGVEASAVNPVLETMLIVDAGKGFQERLAGDGVTPEEVELTIDGPRDWAAQGFFEDVYHAFLTLVLGGGKKEAKLAEDVVLAVAERKGVGALGVAVFYLLGKETQDAHNSRVVVRGQRPGRGIGTALDGT